MKLSSKINREITKISALVLIICLCLFIPWQTHKSRVVNRKLIALMQTFVAKDNVALANVIFENRKRAIHLRIQELLAIEGIRDVAVFDSSGSVVSEENPVFFYRPSKEQFFEADNNDHHSWTKDESLWYLQAVKAFDETMGYVLIEYSLSDIKKKEKLSLIFYALIFTTLIVTMLILSNRLVRKIVLIPVEQLIRNMSHIEKGKYGGQINPISNDEIGDLARRFNAMSSEIDISYKKIENQNQQLQSTEKLLDGIINSMPAALITIDNNFRIKQSNKKAAEKSGNPAQRNLGMDVSDVFPFLKPLLRDIKEIMGQHKSRKFTKVEVPTKDQTQYYDLIVYPIASKPEGDTVILIDNITNLVHMENMIVQSEKMVSVGGLAAGMAHEINNPLAGMIQNAQVISNRMTQDLKANIKAAQELGISMDLIRKYIEKRKIEKLLESMNDSGQRAAQIVKNMLSFSRQSNTEMTTSSIEVILDETISLSENDYDLQKKYDFKEIEIIKEYEHNLPKVECDQSSLQQVFFNILKNGAEAMAEEIPQKDRYKFWLRIKLIQGYLQVEIEDNGPGMSETTLKRIFEPFFTTKGVGIGTGLGLSVSYFIVTENHNGKMWVESVEGAGANFVIQIPL